MAKGLMKGLLLLLFSLLLRQFVSAQVLLLPELQPNGVILKQQLWSVVINNMSGQSTRAILTISVTDRISSQPLLEASSGILVLNPGVKRVMFNDLAPLNYSFASVGFGMDRQLNQPLPVGEYLVCYRLTLDNKNITLANECIKVNAEPLAPPQLILPANEDIVAEPRPVFTWTPPAPVYMFNSLSYDIVVAPLYDKQSPQEALQRNIPAMVTVSTFNSLAYPSSFTNLEAGKKYVWQVTANDAGRFGGKSDVWVFTVIPDSVVRIIDRAPFVKLSNNSTDATVLHQGVLKMEYFNSLPDTAVLVEVYRLAEQNKKQRRTFSFELDVRSGQNFLEYKISNRMRLDITTVYEARLVNSKGESWSMKFIPKYYF